MQPLTERGAGLLGSLLQEGSDDFYWRVLTTLGQRGRESPAAVPVVARLLEHDNPRVAAKAAEVLGRISGGEPPTMAALQNAAHHSQKMVRDAAEQSLQNLESQKE
jgi:HEAT repeat protein